ncbi:hypothetical protein TanjilG_07728 [Lupinus angustifolius]|uniref:Late embryogenesis abundant protein LEA-2 subgroup domain-containing protein n=1 Tax=Lupinus angustifolius TaxID=3871 RepID=A0A1J7FV87_LUPAN|nr:PREDICTED: uncharacterized protein LOC109334691 [Lupinus angustifolius]XP_019426130.1 PREDICTED: uncharacterized protein LOC109334691 [Lupinus angustifolius]OIV91989.1 hypothetical protein TanjilG_07728 [Lupinus angustifolius]
MTSPISAPTPSPDPTTTPMLQKPPGYKSPFKESTPSRKPVLPPTLRPKKKRHCGCCCICCCVIFIIIFVLICAIAIAAGMIYIVYDPKLPEFNVSSFRLNNINVTQKPDGVYLNAETIAKVEVKNKSGKMGWLFDETKVDVTAENGDLDLGTTTVPGFEVKEKEMKELNAGTKIKDIALNERLGKKVGGKEIVPVVNIRTKSGVGLSGWKSWKIGVSVVCGDKSLKQLEAGDTPKCTLTTLKWIKIHF